MWSNHRKAQSTILNTMNKTNLFKAAGIVSLLAICGIIMAFVPPVINWSAMMLLFALGCYEIATTKIEKP